MKTVIFDLDGTLADTSGDLIAAANACFRGLGHTDLLDPIADQLVAFHGGRAMLKLGFSRVEKSYGDEDVEKAFPVLVERYTESIDVHTTLYPGVEAAVTAALEAGYATGICTNKPEKQAEILIDRLGIGGLFGSLVAADTFPVRKPDPLPYRKAVERAGGRLDVSVLIGDTITDVDTARAAGVPIVLVAFGPEGRAIERLEPDAMLESYADLGGVLEGLLDA